MAATVQAKSTSREAKALALVEECDHQIRALGGNRFEVPSCTLAGKRYVVEYGGVARAASASTTRSVAAGRASTCWPSAPKSG